MLVQTDWKRQPHAQRHSKDFDHDTHHNQIRREGPQNASSCVDLYLLIFVDACLPPSVICVCVSVWVFVYFLLGKICLLSS